jgi:hypothetical protein
VQFLAVSFLRADSPDPSEAAAALQNYKPDNTTVFSRKGDLLALGELVLPADAHVNVTSGQVLITQPEGSVDSEPYVRAQRWLDGFMSQEVNEPVAAAANDSDSARTVGARWTLPKPKAASGELTDFCGSRCDVQQPTLAPVVSCEQPKFDNTRAFCSCWRTWHFCWLCVGPFPTWEA